MTRILPRYRDVTGQVRETSADTRAALQAAMGEVPKRTLPPSVVCVVGEVPALSFDHWQLTFEDGDQIAGQGALPALPLGRHKLETEGNVVWLLSAPQTLPLPPRDWGVIVPLYGLAARGIGTYDDLAQVAEALGQAGAGFVGLNPVHTGFPGDSAMISPYSPSHRRRLNPMFLTGAPEGTEGPLVDYATDLPARLNTLRATHDPTDAAFVAWRAQQDAALDRFATYQALSMQHGPTWDQWPAHVQNPDTATANPDDVTFHAWLQWRCEQALHSAQKRAKDAGMRQGLYLDLAVGTHPFGAETWEDRHAFAFGASLGAPPDAFSPDGQNWGLAPLNPVHLERTGFAALADTLRAQLQFCGMLRIDHILGFERAFWVPDGVPGAYVQMPRAAMLAVARIEAARANAVLIGEDLGNVPSGLRKALRDSGLPGCAVAMFEQTDAGFRKPHHYRESAIASFNTHDLPTWAGWRSGHDITTRAELGHITPETAQTEHTRRQAEVAAFDKIAGGDTLEDMLAFIARTKSRLVAIAAEDLLDVVPQPNLPGTVDSYPNWQRRLPIAAPDWAGHTTVLTAARIMQAARRTGDL